MTARRENSRNAAEMANKEERVANLTGMTRSNRFFSGALNSPEIQNLKRQNLGDLSSPAA